MAFNIEVDRKSDAFAKLKDIEPRLGRLEEEIRQHAKRNRKTPRYCANAFWYGYPHVNAVFPAFNGFKDTFVRLVGYSAEISCLKTSEAYSTAYEFLYDLLPNCKKDCACSTFSHPGKENLIL